MQRDKLLRLRIRQRLEQHAVDDREHNRGSAGAEREREQCDRRKTRILAEHAQRIVEVLKQILEPAGAASVAALLFHLLRAAEIEPWAPARFVGFVALCNQLAGVLFEVESQFFFELLIDLLTAPKPIPPVHCAPPSDILRMSPTASDNRRQLAASVSSCARPFRVRR